MGTKRSNKKTAQRQRAIEMYVQNAPPPSAAPSPPAIAGDDGELEVFRPTERGDHTPVSSEDARRIADLTDPNFGELGMGETQAEGDVETEQAATQEAAAAPAC